MSLFAKSGGACLADAPRFELQFFTARWSPDFWKFVDPIAAWNQSQLAAWAGAAKVEKVVKQLALLLVFRKRAKYVDLLLELSLTL